MPPKKAGKKDGAAKLADKENLGRAEAEVLSLQRLLELRSFEASVFCSRWRLAAQCRGRVRGWSTLDLDRAGEAQQAERGPQVESVCSSAVVLCCVQAVEARRSEKLWRERMDAFGQALEKQKEDTLDITADMVRQYKAMQVLVVPAHWRARWVPRTRLRTPAHQASRLVHAGATVEKGGGAGEGQRPAAANRGGEAGRDRPAQRGRHRAQKGVRRRGALLRDVEWVSAGGGAPTTVQGCCCSTPCPAQVLEYQRRMEEMQLDFTQMLRDTLDKMHDRLAGVNH